MEDNSNKRVLGRELSLAELEQIAGSGPPGTTPCSDGCADENGNDVPCCN